MAIHYLCVEMFLGGRVRDGIDRRDLTNRVRSWRCHTIRSDFDMGVIGDVPLCVKDFYRINDLQESLPTLCRIDWVDLNRASEKLKENALRDAINVKLTQSFHFWDQPFWLRG